MENDNARSNKSGHIVYLLANNSLFNVFLSSGNKIFIILLKLVIQ